DGGRALPVSGSVRTALCTVALHDALPISDPGSRGDAEGQGLRAGREIRRQVSWRGQVRRCDRRASQGQIERAVLSEGVRREPDRSEEHTSELQSHLNIVYRLLLEKKKYKT